MTAAGPLLFIAAIAAYVGWLTGNPGFVAAAVFVYTRVVWQAVVEDRERRHAGR